MTYEKRHQMLHSLHFLGFHTIELPGTPSIDHDATGLLSAGQTFEPICSVRSVPDPTLTWRWKDDGTAITGVDSNGKVSSFSWGKGDVSECAQSIKWVPKNESI